MLLPFFFSTRKGATCNTISKTNHVFFFFTYSFMFSIAVFISFSSFKMRYVSQHPRLMLYRSWKDEHLQLITAETLLLVRQSLRKQASAQYLHIFKKICLLKKKVTDVFLQHRWLKKMAFTWRHANLNPVWICIFLSGLSMSTAVEK